MSLPITLDLKRMAMYKTCRACGKEKLKIHFYNTPHHSDGKDSYCASCRRDYNKLHMRTKGLKMKTSTIQQIRKEYEK